MGGDDPFRTDWPILEHPRSVPETRLSESRANTLGLKRKNAAADLAGP
jgi:hypothetical protein